MNKILKLFDENFVLELFHREVLPKFPEFSGIVKVEIRPYKKMVWESTYHVVIGYDVYFSDQTDQEKKIELVCSAHSDEPRRNVFEVLRYLWQAGLPDESIQLPRPLFFSEEFNGTFYRALQGENLLFYIKEHNQAAIEKIVISAARLLAKLHSLPAGPEADFNPSNANIATVIPGAANIVSEVSARYQGRYAGDLEKMYQYFIAQEENFRSRLPRLSLIHGDAHPENILATGSDCIGLIDFTDFCLADPIRDVASFAQQLEYKIMGKWKDAALADKFKELFLQEYLHQSGLVRDNFWEERFQLYYNWTAIRTSTFWFLKFGHNEERALELLEQVKSRLHI